MVLENNYLLKALFKAEYVVIVKNYSVADKTLTLEYISPNAALFGMNVELINKGMKLTEDYIFPEDRSKVMSVIQKAIDSKVSDYSHSYRMVGDDGNLYKVYSEFCISEEKDGIVTVENYLSKALEKEKKSDANTRFKEDKNTDHVILEHTISQKNSDQVQNIISAFSKLSGLYSAYIDNNCNMIFNPVGPAANLGAFYDFFENPEHEKKLKMIVDNLMDSEEPIMFGGGILGDFKIAAANININDKTVGIWILASSDDAEYECMIKCFEDFCRVSEFISDYLGMKLMAEAEVAKSKGAGIKLREELNKQNIINNALSKINSNLYNSVDEVVEETLKEVSQHLNIGKAFVYTRSKVNNKEYKLRSFWDTTGAEPNEDLLSNMANNLYLAEEEIRNNGGRYIVDNINHTEKSKLNIMRFGYKAMAAYPIYMFNKLNGVLFFAEERNERIWTKEELRFIQSIALIIQNMYENARGDDNIRRVNKHLVETYNCFDVGIFIKDEATGEILFSNNVMNKMLGYNFVGGNSRSVLTDLHDRFENIDVIRKPFLANEKVVNWRSYIQVLDDIMDITEIKMEWTDGEPASLIILRKAKEL